MLQERKEIQLTEEKDFFLCVQDTTTTPKKGLEKVGRIFLEAF